MTAAERHKKHYYKAQEKFSFECEFCGKEDFTSSDSLVRYTSVKVIFRGIFKKDICFRGSTSSKISAEKEVMSNPTKRCGKEKNDLNTGARISHQKKKISFYNFFKKRITFYSF